MAIPEFPLIMYLRKQFALVKIVLDFDKGNLLTVHWCNWKTGDEENTLVEVRGVVEQTYYDYIQQKMKDGWTQAL